MGGKSTTSTSQVSIPPEVLARYNAVNAQAENVAQTPFQQYGGDFVAPLTSTQQAGLGNINNAVGYADPYIQAGVGLTAQSAQNLQPTAYSADEVSKYYDPYVKQVYDATAANIQENNRQQMQGEIGNSISKGAFGGDRAGIARAELTRQQNLAGQQTLAGIAQQGYQNAQGQFNTQNQLQLGAAQNTAARQAAAGQQIAGLGTAGQQALLAGANAQLQAGQVEQGTQQADLTAQYNQFLQQKSYPFQVAQFLANIAMGTGALSGSTTTSTSPAPFFSDERLKENIQPVGVTYDGQPIYRYNYKGDDRTQIGLLAQDVAERHPEAVGSDQGYLTLDYRDATNDAAGLAGATHRASGGLVPYQGGGQQGGFPGIASYVPQPLLPVGQLMTAKTPTPKSSTGLGDAMKTAQGAADLFKTGKGFYNDWTKKEETKPGSARGGLVIEHMAYGGLTSGGNPDGGMDDGEDDAPDAPMAGKPPQVQGYVPKADLPVADLAVSKPPENHNKSPFGEIVDAAKTAAKFFAFADGGEVDETLDPNTDFAARTMLTEDPKHLDAIAWVLKNRAENGGYGGKTLAEVATAPKQFSPWNPENQGGKNDPRLIDPGSPRYQEAVARLRAIQNGEVPDPTGGATHFLNPAVTRKQRGDGSVPAWAGRMMASGNTTQIGDHVYGRADGPGSGPQEGLGRALALAPPDLGLSGAEGVRVAQAASRGPSGRPTATDAEEPGLLSGLGGVGKRLDGMSSDAKLSLLAGLFGMLGSQNHFLLPAIGDGGLAAIKTYKDLTRNTADIENTNAQSRATNVGAITASMVSTPYGNFVFAADGRILPLDVFYKKPVPLAGVKPSGQMVQDYLRSQGGYPSATAAGAQPEGARAQPNAQPESFRTPLPQGPAAGTAAGANDTIAAPPVGKVESAPLAPPIGGAENLPTLPPDMLAAAKREADLSLRGGQAYKTAEKTTEDTRARVTADGQAQQTVQPMLNDLAKAIASAPPEGFQTPGTAAELRNNIVKIINTGLRASGQELIGDPNTVSSQEIANKIKLLTSRTNAGDGQVAGYIVDMFQHTVPSFEMEPQAAAAMIGEMYLKQQRTLDMQREFQDYLKHSNGLAGDFQTAFLKAHPTEEYERDKDAIKQAMLTRSRDGKKTLMQVILSNPNITAAQIDKQLGRPGISRYFGRGQ